MILFPRSFALLWMACSAVSSFAEEPATANPGFPLPVKLGPLLVDENFSASDAVAKWRLGKGLWTVREGALMGVEKLEDKHAAGLACQRAYHNAAIQFRFQFNGGRSATLLLRNQFGNLCRVIISPAAMTMQKDRPNSPKDTPEKTVVLGQKPISLKSGEWYSVRVVVQGSEFAVEIPGQVTLKGHHSGIDVEKMEIEFMASGDSILFDDLQAWQLP